MLSVARRSRPIPLLQAVDGRTSVRVDMCNKTGIAFVSATLSDADVRGKRVLEAGARDVNGSARPEVEALGPGEYLGVDIEEGSGVDEVCDVGELARRYGAESFDVVIATELVEHVRDWRSAFWNMKSVLRPGGSMIVTTRSRGFKIHGYPYDYWRYELDDMRVIFSDFAVEAIRTDAEAPGVFIKARKPVDWTPATLDGYSLYSVVVGKRSTDISRIAEARFKLSYHLRHAYRRLLPEHIRAPIRRILRFPQRSSH
jgi:SAM-dependent methyltransferase